MTTISEITAAGEKVKAASDRLTSLVNMASRTDDRERLRRLLDLCDRAEARCAAAEERLAALTAEWANTPAPIGRAPWA